MQTKSQKNNTGEIQRKHPHAKMKKIQNRKSVKINKIKG